jgi:uncharacterized protein (TIGR03435 family)
MCSLLQAKVSAGAIATSCQDSICRLPPEIREMLQTLLADRFKLSVRHTTKEIPIYALSVSKNGPARNLHVLRAGEEAPSTKGFQRVGPNDFGGHVGGGGGVFNGITMQIFAENLNALLGSGEPTVLGRPVIDKTGLEGRYYFTLLWKDSGDLAGGLRR